MNQNFSELRSLMEKYFPSSLNLHRFHGIHHIVVGGVFQVIVDEVIEKDASLEESIDLLVNITQQLRRQL
jgi:hypothetical protein